MRLIIAEKPSLARAIAAALPGTPRQVDQHLECGSGDVVAWCAGHILEVAPPEDYAAEWKSWSLDPLPLVPSDWRHRITRRELVGSLRKLLRRATTVVHAGDPDREGQLLVDEVLLFLGWQGPTLRLLVTDLNTPAVRRALSVLERNDRYRPLYAAALGRQRADWLYGMNLTRLYTLRARLGGYQGVLSVGRVQTPLLGLIVRRDREIERFVSKPFYGVDVRLRTTSGSEFTAQWAAGKEHERLTDPEGRLLVREVAEAVSQKIAGQRVTVTSHDQKRQSEPPPLPYSLADLQIDAGRRLGLSAAAVLEVAQHLYERQLITYPRSDCSHLPEEHFGQGREVLSAIAFRAPRLAEACAAADVKRRSKAWDDAKVTAHHAIIPSSTQVGVSLTGSDLALYELIAERYIQQFLPPFEYLQTKVAFAAAGETFVARGRQMLALGWRVLAKKDQAEKDDGDDHDDNENASLPPLIEGQELHCSTTKVVEKRTKPPKAFTDASLIAAMCNVAKFVSDPKARKILQDTDGIGTPATRAAIIETLFERRFVERTKKQIRSTPIGRALIDALPSVATTPDMTAVWESALRRIHDGELPLDRFLAVVTQQLGELVLQGKAQGALRLPESAEATSTRAGARRPSRKAAPKARSRRAPRAARAPRTPLER